MRRKDREKDAQWALDTMKAAPYITVAMTRPDGTPYAVPLSLAEHNGKWYFHCALTGEKIDILEQNPHVCLTAVTEHDPFFEESKLDFSTRYKSAIAFGIAETVTDDSEKTEALRAICMRYLPANMEHFDAAIRRSLKATAVVRITLTSSPTGKERS